MATQPPGCTTRAISVAALTGSCARVAELTFGRIDGAHRTRGAARDQNLGKGAVAAPDVYPAEAVRHSEPIKEYFTHDAAPTTHPPFVGFAISEKIFDFAHVKFLCAVGHYANGPFGWLKSLIQILSTFGDVRLGSEEDILAVRRRVRSSPKSGHS